MCVYFPGGAGGREPAFLCRRGKRCRFNPWVRKIPWRRAQQPTPVFLPGESHEQRSPGAYSLWDRRELDMTEQPEHAYMCTYMCAHICVHIYVCMLSHFCCGLSFPTHTHTYIYTCTHIYKNIYTHIHVYIHMYVSLYLSIYISCIHTKSYNCEIPSDMIFCGTDNFNIFLYVKIFITK